MIIQSIFSGLGIFGLIVVILALMLFSFYLQLVIARSKDNLEFIAYAWLFTGMVKQECIKTIFTGLYFDCIDCIGADPACAMGISSFRHA